MEMLPATYTRGTNQLHGGQFHHTRIDDGTQKKAMYKVEFKPTGSDRLHLVGYEVFQIRIQKPMSMTVGGVTINYAEKERTPSDEAFGDWAFNCSTLEQAEKKFAELPIYEIPLDENGNEIKRKRGRPAKMVA